MMRIEASAPGKLFLLGDYAVLDGAPALLVAVNRRARVVLETRGDDALVVHAPDLGIDAARAVVEAHGNLVWGSPAAADRLGLVTAIWHALASEGLAPAGGAEVQLDTSGFFEDMPQGRRKLGLGSSAALTVALAAALARAAGKPLAMTPAWLARLIALHGAWQGGRGSGADIATSLAGGLGIYRRDPTAPTWAPALWPPAGVHCLFVWSGEAVSTAGYLARLAAWRQTHAAAYAARMGELCTLAEAALAALHGSAEDFVALVAAYGVALERFAAASGLVIHSPQQVVAARLAQREGAAFKPCGAGGDFGVVVAHAAPQLERVRRAIMAAGLRVEGLAMEPPGAQCDVSFMQPGSP